MMTYEDSTATGALSKKGLDVAWNDDENRIKLRDLPMLLSFAYDDTHTYLWVITWRPGSLDSVIRTGGRLRVSQVDIRRGLPWG